MFGCLSSGNVPMKSSRTCSRSETPMAGSATTLTLTAAAAISPDCETAKGELCTELYTRRATPSAKKANTRTMETQQRIPQTVAQLFDMSQKTHTHTLHTSQKKVYFPCAHTLVRRAGAIKRAGIAGAALVVVDLARPQSLQVLSRCILVSPGPLQVYSLQVSSL